MTHQELEHLASDYLEGALDAIRQAQARAHLDECAPCREMIAGLERVLEITRAAEDIEPAPWLANRILLATVGERKPTLGERLAAMFKPTLQPRLVYGIAMAVFSISFILHNAGVSARQVTWSDLKPTNWVSWADRNGHLLVARAEKFAYDLRVVYEIESRLKQLRGQGNQPASQPGEQGQPPKSGAPSGGTTESKPAGPPVLAKGDSAGPFNRTGLPRLYEAVSLIQVPGSPAELARSSTR